MTSMKNLFGLSEDSNYDLKVVLIITATFLTIGMLIYLIISAVELEKIKPGRYQMIMLEGEGKHLIILDSAKGKIELIKLNKVKE